MGQVPRIRPYRSVVAHVGHNLGHTPAVALAGAMYLNWTLLTLSEAVARLGGGDNLDRDFLCSEFSGSG